MRCLLSAVKMFFHLEKSVNIFEKFVLINNYWNLIICKLIIIIINISTINATVIVKYNRQCLPNLLNSV